LVLVGIFCIGAALLLICGLVALEVALLESKRAFLPQNSAEHSVSTTSQESEDEGAVSVADFVLAARLTIAFLLMVVGVVLATIVGGNSAVTGAASEPRIVAFLLTAVLAFGAAAVAATFGYLLPHFIGACFRDPVLKYLAPLGRFVVRVVWPVVAAARIMKQLGVKNNDGGSAVEEETIEEDIRSLVEEGERAGVIEEEEREMITRVFRLGDKPIASLMTPKNDVVFLTIGMTVADAVSAALDSRLTWFPVRQEIDDEVVGIVSVHDVVGLQSAGPSDSVADLKAVCSPAMDVPESMTALELLERFKEFGAHFAVVRDEYGSVAGIATVDDVVQVVVGDMGEANGEERSVTVRDDGSLLVDASFDVQNLFETLGFSGDSDGDQGQFHSVGGFVMTSLGRIPKAGDSFMHDGYRFEVVDMDGKRIDKVLVARVAGQRAVGG